MSLKRRLLPLLPCICLALMTAGCSSINNNGNCVAQGGSNSVSCTEKVVQSGGGASLSSDPQEQIVQLTGSYTEQGFVDAIIDRETNIVALYLKTGMAAATLHEGTSAILFGFQGVPQNGDPIALVKTFQAGGFKVDGELKDSFLMGKLSDNLFPLQFDTKLTPAGYTGGYEGGWFVGSLLFWIVQISIADGVGGQNLEVIKYLISQGADCKIALSFINYSISTSQISADEVPKELLSTIQGCAK